MRIGIIAPPWVPIPPPGYGGIELVVDTLARGLVARGHELHLFTVGSSTCPVRRHHLFAEPVTPMGGVVEEAAHVLAAYEDLARCDVIHDHTVVGPMLGASMAGANPPIVVTNHGPFTAVTRRIYAQVARHAALVAISRDQAAAAQPVPIAAVIHHGLDLAAYAMGDGRGGYLLFVGRMSPDKGAHRAVRIARRAGWPLVLVTKIWEAPEREYFEARVRPLLGSDVSVVNDPELEHKRELFQGAHALLNPITWPEPFGLVMIEALASGTPVLAFPSGAAPEIVLDGRTGFLCQDEDSMVARIPKVADLRRSDCRRAAATDFSMDRMAADHESLYRAVADDHLASEMALPVPR